MVEYFWIFLTEDSVVIGAFGLPNTITHSRLMRLSGKLFSEHIVFKSIGVCFYLITTVQDHSHAEDES